MQASSLYFLSVSSNIDAIHRVIIFNPQLFIDSFGEGYPGLSSLAPDPHFHVFISVLHCFIVNFNFFYLYFFFILLTILYTICLPLNFIFFVLASWPFCSSSIDVKWVLKYYFISNSKSF